MSSKLEQAWRKNARLLREVGRLDFASALDLVRATVELAIARLLVARCSPDDLFRRAGETPLADRQVIGSKKAIAKRVSVAICRMAARVPWRSDCLVQAVAAQRWLFSLGLVTTFVIGTRKDPVSGFSAHAWLRLSEAMVTGGDVEGYIPLVVLNEQPITDSKRSPNG